MNGVLFSFNKDADLEKIDEILRKHFNLFDFDLIGYSLFVAKDFSSSVLILNIVEEAKKKIESKFPGSIENVHILNITNYTPVSPMLAKKNRS